MHCMSNSDTDKINLKTVTRIVSGFLIMAFISVFGLNYYHNRFPKLQYGVYTYGEFSRLALDQGEFTFVYDPLSSYLNWGKVTRKGNKLICITDDGLYTFVFEVIDSETVAFVASGSEELMVFDEITSDRIEDGTCFHLRKEN